MGWKKDSDRKKEIKGTAGREKVRTPMATGNCVCESVCESVGVRTSPYVGKQSSRSHVAFS